MTKREMNLRIFEGKEIPEVLFQPRIEYWYVYNKERDLLPERYKEMSLLELFDDLGVSIRYIGYYTGLNDVIGTRYSEKVKVEQRAEGDRTLQIYTTPKGELVNELKRSEVAGGFFPTKFAINSADDIGKGIYLFENTTFYFIKENFEKGEEFFGERGIPQFWVPKSSYQALAQQWMSLEDLVYALNDYPDKVGRLMTAIDNSYDNLYEEIISSGLVEIVNFGENIDVHADPPQYFEKYCIPFYAKRATQLKKAGIYTHIHIDGNFKPLLKYLKDLPFDGLEALTPLPQGDVALEEMKEAIGDKILLDGIPAIFFLPDYPLEELQKFLEKLIKLFHPKLVLGASDEVPPPADIEKVRYISGKLAPGSSYLFSKDLTSGRESNNMGGS